MPDCLMDGGADGMLKFIFSNHKKNCSLLILTISRAYKMNTSMNKQNVNSQSDYKKNIIFNTASAASPVFFDFQQRGGFRGD